MSDGHLHRLEQLVEDLEDRLRAHDAALAQHDAVISRLLTRETACGLTVDRLERLLERALGLLPPPREPPA